METANNQNLFRRVLGTPQWPPTPLLPACGCDPDLIPDGSKLPSILRKGFLSLRRQGEGQEKPQLLLSCSLHGTRV
jgi:hypothetical protein